MATVEALYVIQPYAHLQPLLRKARRLGLHLVYAAPRDTPALIEMLGDGYCGLTPLPLILRYSLEVYTGPMVWTGHCSPSLVVITPEGLEPCECRTLIVSEESISTRTYASLLAERCGFSIETRAIDAETAIKLAEAGVCALLIGDEGIRAWIASQGKRVKLSEFSALASSILGMEGFAFAATAGPGCRRIKEVLEGLSRIRPSMIDALRIARLLRIPIPLAARYLKCTRLEFNQLILLDSLHLLSKRLGYPRDAVAIASSSLGGGIPR